MFENFISLGYYCGVAASMSKLGIRSYSGPFDWYISDFKGVIQCLQNDFYDFLNKKNLRMTDEKNVFEDIKYQFRFNHEIRTDFETDYEMIHRKYLRRIDIFKNHIQRETCFIRAIKNYEEFKYIKNNLESIKEVVKKYNQTNDIIYIVSNSVISDIFERGGVHPFYFVDFFYSAVNKRELRALFDSNTELQNFCIQNFDENKRNKNLVFDLQQQNLQLEISAYRYELLDGIDKIDTERINIPKKIIIYGAGKIGKKFYQKIGNKCEVLFFVDGNPQTDFYCGTRIIKYEEFEGDRFSQIPIIITPCYEFQSIYANLIKKYGEMNIVPLSSFFWL